MYVLAAAGGVLGGMVRSVLGPRVQLALNCDAGSLRGYLFNALCGLVGGVLIKLTVASPAPTAGLLLASGLAGYVSSDVIDSVWYILTHSRKRTRRVIKRSIRKKPRRKK